MSFEGQCVVVTGGTRGLGRAIVLSFLEEGATVHATYRSNEVAAESLRDRGAAHADRLIVHRFDVADHDASRAFWESVEERTPGGVQVLVNCAGVRRDAVLAMMSPEDWSDVLSTNLGGCYNMSKFAVMNMVPQRYGRIILITSPAGRFGFEGQGNYGASKAGQVGLMRSLCKEVAKRGITVNCVSPGFVDTELIDDLPPELRDRYKAMVPMRRFGKPEEVAYAVKCLAARDAGYITGTTLEVTGGL